MSIPQEQAAREGRFVFLLGALVAFGPLAIDLYLPALPAIASGLPATAEAVQLSITVFLAGFGLGMLFYGPISDRYGRRQCLRRSCRPRRLPAGLQAPAGGAFPRD